MATSDENELFAEFAARFHAGKRVRPAKPAQLDEAETALKLLLPQAYREFALKCGAIYCPALAEVQQFLTPKQSVTETRRWRLGPEGGCAALASDSSGSFFAFRNLVDSPPRAVDAAVWLFDHENDTVATVADSFTGWIRRMLSA